MEFISTELFGGAIVVDLPACFVDASNIRQVPDNQEVFLDSNGFTSLIFDLTERVDAPAAGSDEEALKYHFSDIIDEETNEDSTRIWQSGAVGMGKMASHPAYTLLATQHPPSPKTTTTTPTHPPKPTPDFTAILLLLLRLEAQKTDIVVTINVPHAPGEYAATEVDFEKKQFGALTERARAALERVRESFEVREWGLFVE
ncbi:Mog1p/PsbP-like protein [Saccharata proteae CBS 121410]|uniref:Mog1p/PsbP-like protein n=1 Tax=Saccharata proteae CBS 121410 TaxID=1314787 RepID=A0A9P4LU65_9PEZI|nr:Mog1p/PsbP-like protein [Saccharata proteae CBS 121410]